MVDYLISQRRQSSRPSGCRSDGPVHVLGARLEAIQFDLSKRGCDLDEQLTKY
ncbi:Uncharacterised protein [Mycobacteroides abscessus subsp. abscessus]|nr:Uncharacterised protein [Mycobacteroides abscessus subsp. abscessus]